MDAASSAVTRMQGYLGAARKGLAQGAYCLGSSWPLMLVLLLVGMMNLAWMGVIAGVIFVEKVLPRGHVAGKVVGWGLAGWGIILLVAPHALPTMSHLL
jgi:predicted metal-binding membrane protein